MSIFRKIASAMIAAVVLAALPAAASEIVDVTGRRVEMALPAKRILLGEARQIHIAAALKGEHVFDTIVGWRDDLIKKDPDSYAAYVERFPEIEKLPRFEKVPGPLFVLQEWLSPHPTFGVSLFTAEYYRHILVSAARAYAAFGLAVILGVPLGHVYAFICAMSVVTAGSFLATLPAAFCRGAFIHPSMPLDEVSE